VLQPDHRIIRAWLTSATTGVIELDTDWLEESLPLLVPADKAFTLASLEPALPATYAEEAAYFVDDEGRLVFVLDPAEHSWIDFARTAVYVAGDFNGWQDAIGRPEWQLQAGELLGREMWLLRTDSKLLTHEPPARFKFVTGDQHWLDLSPDATNAMSDGAGHFNRVLHRRRTGRNLFQFVTHQPLEPSRSYSVIHLRDGEQSPKVRLRLGRYFHALRSALPLGAIVRKDETVFRLFAPRARHVRLFVAEKLEALDQAFVYELDQKQEGGEWRGVWEARLDRNLHGWFYWYSVSGPQNVFGHFSPSHRILDPYALAAVGREGPGIVLDPAWVGQGDRSFRTPSWQDLVIAEAHVRDLTAHAPVAAGESERLGFVGLRKWVESPDFYLKKLGVNAVELQPVQEFDNRSREEYHWGYMTSNWFAPASAYSSDPARASGVRELQELVAAFHRQGMAVILDVVYNHAGEPAHLLYIDKLYYFELGDDGTLSNWSGCGNDTRCRSAMMKRLIIDSCVYLIETYGVDGFRFDLAELIGVSVLREIEMVLKRTKPDVILIAEPWSFRGHIAAALRPTGWASWNDGYRNFLRDYVLGRGGADKLEYFLKGSPWHFAYWPAQTVNYTESHDDRTWLDAITENADGNGWRPTLNDVQRTHLMAAMLFMSVGMPMVTAGQDFLRSKRGVNNTYRRGDLNALDYRRIRRFPATHAYFRDWIAFRQSETGRLLRHYSRSGEGFFRACTRPGHPALVLIYNADGRQGSQRLMFAVNPLLDDVTVSIGDEANRVWRLVADHECFYSFARPAPAGATVEPELFVPALGCALWVAED
jgi:pullulanase